MNLQWHLNPGRRHFILFATAALLISLAAWGSGKAGTAKEMRMRKELVRQAIAVAATIPIEEAQALSFTLADLNRPEYRRLCNALKAYAKTAGLRSIYTISLRDDGKLVFGPESMEPDDLYSSKPGEVYQQPQQDNFDIFKIKTPFVAGPYTDEFGSFVSAVAPVIHPRNGQVLFTVGIDIETPEWQAEIRRARQIPLLVVLIPLALLMKWRHHAPSGPGRHLHHLEPVVCAGISLLLTLALALLVAHEDRIRRTDTFYNTAWLKAGAYQANLHNLNENIRMLARFFEASEKVTAEEFSRISEPVLQNHAIEGCVWIPEVPSAERAAFEAALRAAGFPGFSIRPLPGADGNDELDAFYPAVYIVSDDEEEEALGYDLASEPVRRAALREALQSGQVTATDPVRLAALPEAPDGLFLFYPVNAADQKGIIALTLRPDRLLSSLSSQTQRDSSDLRVCLLQIGADETPRTLFCPAGLSVADCIQAAPPGLQGSFPLFSFGKPYVLCITPENNWLEAHPLQRARLVLFGGLALSALLTMLISILANRPHLLENEVRKRTAELRESEERLALATEAGGIGVWDRDLVNNRLLWDDRMYALYGISKKDFGGAYEAWRQHVHPDALERVSAEVAAAERGEKEFDTEFRIIRPDGEIRHLRAFARAIRDPSGKPLRMIGTNQDITAFKQMEEKLRQRLGELELFNKAAVGREMRMIELKKEINALSRELGREAPYSTPSDS